MREGVHQAIVLEKCVMKRVSSKLMVTIAVLLAISVAGSKTMSAPDDNGLKVPNGLAFSEFKGYEAWQVISISYNGGKMAAILGNPAMIDAFKAGIPANGKPFPDGAKMAKIHWNPKKNLIAPGPPLVPDTLHDIDFMVKDSARFADSGGWGWGAFDYEASSNTFTPATVADKPPQANDAKCGFACHTIVKQQDYVFTKYAKRNTRP
jgi:Cytochrome P460